MPRPELVERDRGPWTWGFKKVLFVLLLVHCPLSMVTGPLHAQSTQFYIEDDIGTGHKARIYLVGQPQAKAMVQEALYAAIDHARAATAKMESELTAINQQKGQGKHMVSPELASAVAAGLELGSKTNGLVDITGVGNYKRIQANLRSNTLKIKADNVQLNLEPILNGFLADLIANDLSAAGWGNCLVKIGNVYVTRGNDASAPWRIPVVVPSEKIAKRVLYYQAKQEKAAGATGQVGKEISAGAGLNSVTIFSASGADSEGLAAAVLKMGMEEGKKFLARNKNLSAIFVDSQGNLTNVP
ncbi:MAG: FAD:protein FMN transferase [Deltaproteobacteria bacterium]|nr:FAD:protein FMN transferase [Deltaproteobacteria bacterium]